MDKFIDIDGQNVHYCESGPDQAQAIILMHGWGCNASTLNSVEKVAQESCHVYNIDFPGFGKSPEPENIWGVPEYTRMLELFIEKLGIENPILLGHSFGGRVGILYASEHAVNKLILVDAAGVKSKKTGKKTLKSRIYKLGKSSAKLMGKTIGGKFTYWLGSIFGSEDYRNASPKMRQVMSKTLALDLQYAMPDIKAPTLLIWGENDTATPLSDALIMEKLIPGAGLVKFPGCGHYSFLDNPGQFAAVLRVFLRS